MVRSAYVVARLKEARKETMTFRWSHNGQEWMCVMSYKDETAIGHGLTKERCRRNAIKTWRDQRQ